jgi:ATP-binding cassette subfamily B multidrug efflux pump
MGAETPRYETSEQRQEARLAAIQNDFAGRIANRVMQTGPAIRETLLAMLTGVWYIMVYGTTALILLASADPVLALPVVLWFAGYFLLLRILVPR